MARDYKPRAKLDRRKTTPGWVWLLAGLAVGLFIAFLTYLHGTRAPEVPVPAQIDKPVESAEEAVPPPAPEPPAKPRFDFYTILPEMEVVIPEQDVTGKVKAGVAQVEKPGTYFLQAGSFRTFDQADRLKAQLALLGLRAGIETVTINNTETWHRVRVGPYENLDDLNRARALLKENNINAVLLKVKG